jgi:gas vesicle protein
MARHQQESLNGQNILLGIAAGTVVGALAAFAFSTKGKDIREGIRDAYHHAGDAVNQAINNFSESSQSLSDRFLSRQRKPQHLDLTVGAIAGGILGISAILFLNSESAKGIRSHICESCEQLSDKAQDWQEFAQDAVENLEDKISPWIQKAQAVLNAIHDADSFHHSNNGTGKHKPIDKILDFVSTAAQLVQSFKK